jgi:hypothetical protein
MDDALSLLMFFFFIFFCIGYTGRHSLADQRWGVFAFGGLNWHFANVFRGEYYYSAYIATRHMFILS